MNDVADILPFDEHIRFADGVRFAIEFLTIHYETGICVLTAEMFVRHRKHPSSSGSRIVQCADNARFCQCIIIFDKQQVDHQPNDFAWREMFPSRFVGDFRKFAYQLLKDGSHLFVTDGFRVQIDIGKFFGNQIQQICFGESFYLSVKIKSFKDIANIL